MFEDANGVGVRVEGGLDTSDETVDRLRDLLMIQLDKWGLSLRDIGRILNTPKSTVHYRLRTIPPHAREYYERAIRRMERPRRSA